jgi:hypothetical protein
MTITLDKVSKNIPAYDCMIERWTGTPSSHDDAVECGVGDDEYTLVDDKFKASVITLCRTHTDQVDTEGVTQFMIIYNEEIQFGVYYTNDYTPTELVQFVKDNYATVIAA